jgi:hypothetical protein
MLNMKRTLTTMLVTAVAACTFATPAQASLTRSQMFAKAAGQAAFQCFVHDCSKRRILGVSGPYTGGLILYKWRYYGMHDVGVHAYWSRCDQYIKVSPQGVVSQYRFMNCV